MFKIGQTVECIRDDWNDPNGPMKHPVKGKKYTITGINKPGFFCIYKVDHLQLVGFGHNAYASCYFRPIVERETDISVFKALLNPVPEDANV